MQELEFEGLQATLWGLLPVLLQPSSEHCHKLHHFPGSEI